MSVTAAYEPGLRRSPQVSLRTVGLLEEWLLLVVQRQTSKTITFIQEYLLWLKSSLKDVWITITGHTASLLVVNGAIDRSTETGCWAPTDDEEIIASCLGRK